MLGGDTAVAIAGRTSSTHIPGSGSPSPDTSLSDLIGTTLAGRYKIERKIGQGGMGAVFEATHIGIGKPVAVKVLLEKYAQRAAIVQRLEQEAKLAAQAKNEHIIDVNDIGQTDDGRTFVVMELLKGESLAECLIREVKLAEQRILRIASQAASALAAAHAEGIVHRDIKPENLFLLDRGKDKPEFVKVVDFGISKSLRSSDAGDDEDAPRLTQTGMVLGTPLYMSPEQARGDDTLDHRVDIYALGVIMYEASTGRVPFIGTNYLSVISQVLNEQPVSPRELRPELSEEFEAIVLRAMAKDREDRYPNATKLLEDLNALLDDPTRSTERAKITGPRRKPGRKSGLKVVTWVAVVAVIVAAIAVTVAVTMGGGGGGDTKPAAAIDAGVAIKPTAIDAAVAVVIDAPATITFHVETDPPGATIARDNEELCTSPCDVDVVDRDRDVEIRASLDNYEDSTAKINPLEHHADAKKQVHIKLKKLPKLPPGQQPHAGIGAGSGHTVRTPGTGSAAPGSRTGELQGYPLDTPPAGSGK
jgi:serine/threonine-protein kinase